MSSQTLYAGSVQQATFSPPDIDWTDIGNAAAGDSSYASVQLSPGETAAAIFSSNYGFSIPAGATIDGVTVNFSGFVSEGGTIRDASISLAVAGVPTGTDNVVGVDWTSTSGEVITYGNAADLWGLSLSVADINDPDFGAYAQWFHTTASGNAVTLNIDYIEITVDYTPDPTMYPDHLDSSAVVPNPQISTLFPKPDAIASNTSVAQPTSYSNIVVKPNAEQLLVLANDDSTTPDVDWEHPLSQHSPLNRGLIAYFLAAPELNGYRWRNLRAPAHATLIQAYWSRQAPPGGRGSLRVTGESSGGARLTATNVGDFTQHTPYTAAGWFKLDSLASQQSLISKLTFPLGWELLVNTDGTVFTQLRVDGFTDVIAVTTARPIGVGVWVHIAMTYDGRNSDQGFRIYFNGVSQPLTGATGSTLTGSPLNTAGIGIGGRDMVSNLPLSGWADDIRIYSRMLSAGEVAALYRDALTGHAETLNFIAGFSVFTPSLLNLGTVYPATTAFVTNVAAGTIAAATSVPQPTAASASTVVTPNAIASATSVPQPTVDLDLTVVAGTVTAGTSVLQPTAALGGITIVAGTVTAGTSVLQPTIGLTLTVAAGTVTAGTSVLQPTIGLTLTVAAGTVAANTTVRNATADLDLTVSPNTLSGGTSVPQPAFELAGTVNPTNLAATTSVSNPTIALGGLTVTPNTVTAGTSVPQPTIGLTLTVTAGTVAAGTSVPQPTIALGAIAAIAGTVAAATSVFQATIDLDLSVTAGTVSSATSVPQPTVDLDLTVTAGTVVAATAVYNPTLALTLAVVAGTVAAGTSVPQPALNVPITVRPNAIGSGTSVLPPTLVVPATVVPSAIASNTVVRTASMQVSDLINPAELESLAAVSAPVLALGGEPGETHLLSSDTFVSDSTGDWQTLLTLDASRFGGLDKYFILASLTFGTTNTNLTAEFRLARSGGSVFDGSLAVMRCRATATTVAGMPYQYFTVFTQGAVPESILLQGRKTNLIGQPQSFIAKEAQLFALKISDLTENTDYFYSETNVPVNLLPTSSFTDLIAATPASHAAGEHYMALGQVHFTTNNTSSGIEFRWKSGGEHDANYLAGSLRTVPSATDLQLSWAWGNLYVIATATPVNPFGIRGANTSAGVYAATTVNSSRLFVLRLGVFDNHQVKTRTDVGGGSGVWTDVAGHSHAYTETDTNILAISSTVHLPNSSGASSLKRWRSFETGDPTTAATNPPGFENAQLTDNWSTAEQFPLLRIASQPVGTDPYTIGMQRYIAAGTNTDSVTSWSFLSNAGPESPSPEGTGPLALPALTMAGEGDFDLLLAGSGAITLPGLTLAGAGEYEIADREGSDGPAMPGMAISGAGVFYIVAGSGVGEMSLPAMEMDGNGTFTDPGCDPFEYHEHGREPISVCQEFRMGTDYPFVAPSEDIRYLVADFFLAYDDPSDYDDEAVAFQTPFRIGWLFGGCISNTPPDFVTADAFHTVDIIIFDANNRVVFDSTEATNYKSQEWGDRLMIHEWQTATAVARIVLHTKWHAADELPAPTNYHRHLVPTSSVLDSRTIKRMPKRVRKVIVDQDELTGLIDLVGGYNVELANNGALSAPTPTSQLLNSILSPSTGGGRDGYQVLMSAEPGSGEGQAPGCEEVELTITTINGISPDPYGNFVVGGGTRTEDAGCYWFETPATRNAGTATVTPATLQMNNDCLPCCTCDDYVQVKLGIDSVYQRWKGIADNAVAIRDTYVGIRDRWIAQKNCREGRNQRLNLTTNCVGFIGVGYSFCSNADECEGPLEVRFSFLLNTPPPEPPPELPPVELINNWNFAQGLSGWTAVGRVVMNDAGNFVQIGSYSNDRTNHNLLAGALTHADWVLSGDMRVATNVYPGFRSGEEYISPINGALAFNPSATGGGASRTIPAADGISYFASVNVLLIAPADVRLVVASSTGVELLTQSAARNAELPGSEERVISGQLLAIDDELEFRIESFIGCILAAASAPVLEPGNGHLSQVVTNLVPGKEYRLRIVVRQAIGSFSKRVTVTTATGSTVLSFDLADEVNTTERFKVVEKKFVATTQVVGIRIATTYNPLETDGILLTSVSLQSTSSTTDSGADADSDGGTNRVRIALVPNSAKKSDLGSSKLRPYEMSGTYPNLAATWVTVEPRRVARLSFVVYACDAVDGDSITVIASATLGGVQFAEVEETIALNMQCVDPEALCETDDESDS